MKGLNTAAASAPVDEEVAAPTELPKMGGGHAAGKCRIREAYDRKLGRGVRVSLQFRSEKTTSRGHRQEVSSREGRRRNDFYFTLWLAA